MRGAVGGKGTSEVSSTLTAPGTGEGGNLQMMRSALLHVTSEDELKPNMTPRLYSRLKSEPTTAILGPPRSGPDAGNRSVMEGGRYTGWDGCRGNGDSFSVPMDNPGRV